MADKKLLPPRIIFAISGDMVRDAAAIREIVVDSLGQFKRGEMSIKDAYCISTLARQAIDAMKLEYIFGPRVLHERGKESS